MFRDFNDYLVLTSRDPGGFLNFRYEAGDPSIYFVPEQNADVSEGTLWVNGLDISEDASIYDVSLGYAIYIGQSGDPSIASFHVYTRSLENFNTNLRLNLYDSTFAWFDVIDVSILNRPFSIDEGGFINTNETSEVQVDGDTSYMLMRTNPKFTGNIKLTIDTSNNLYLDTFKISDILNNKKYRKQAVSANSVFSGDVRRVFSDMPLGELYRLDAEDTLNIAIPKTEIYKQYNLNYSYGARLFLDELYEDDYNLVAPLWINNKLPDYFAIFRIDGVFNEETYLDDPDLVDLAEKYLEEGELIKSWGIKDSTPLGTYMRSHLDELLAVRAPLFLSLSDPTQLDPDPNTWYGIAVDKGIITGRSETPYFFDQADNYTDLNAFLSEGYERNNLLCPNLINMEYVFSDHDVSLYTMHRYYGLYLTENELYSISYYADEPDASINILSLDGKDSSVFFNSSIFDGDGSIASDYSNRLFTLDDLLEIKRITNVNQINGSNKEYIEKWLNKPGPQLFSVEVDKLNINSFISLKINNKLSQGEHLRVVDKSQFKLWEAYAVEWDILEAGESITYASTYEEPGYPTVYRTCFSIKGEISDQIKAIKSAFDVFEDYSNVPFTTAAPRYPNSTDNELSFEISDWAVGNDLWFQRLTAQTVDDPLDPSSAFNAAAQNDDIIFYGVFTPANEDFERIDQDASYGPINFEIFGDRRSIEVNIFDPTGYNIYSFDSSTVQDFQDYNMYMGDDGWYRIIYPFDVSTLVKHSFNYVTDPTSESGNYIVITEHPIQTVHGKWNGYATYPLIISLMGINPVKDMDFTVYDATLGFESEYWYARQDDASSYYMNIGSGTTGVVDIQGSYEILSGQGLITIGSDSSEFVSSFNFNTFDSSALIEATTPVLLTYNVLDGSKSYSSYIPGESEENIENYYLDPSTTLKYGLTVPYVAKWEGLGQDARNNPFRLLLDGSLISPDVSSNYISNFITFRDPSGFIHYDGEMTYPSFKYLTPGEHAWKDYVFLDINDAISDGSTFKTFKELMLTEPYIDIFSKFVYSNYNVDDTQLRSSIVYYNDYKQTVDTLVNGLSLSFRIDEEAKNIIDIRDWDRFRISLVSTPSRNRSNNNTFEVIINENTETILMIWYQGADVLNYNKRYSSIVPGKGVVDGSTNEFNFQSYITGNQFYSHFKTPFFVNNSSLSSSIVNLFQYEFNYDSSICTPYAQLNFNFGDQLNSIFNAYSYNYAAVLTFLFNNKQYNTFDQFVNYQYFKNTSTFGSLVLNHAYTYAQNENIYKDQTCSFEILEEVFNNNSISYYMWREEELFTNSSFSAVPVTISINTPRSYKGMYTYNGWYRPSFNDILNFKANEDLEIIDTLELDFTFGNTNFQSYVDIPQYWYNKVVDQVTTQDINSGDAIHYLEDFNVFKAQWDNDYYIIDASDGSQSYTEGYHSSLELPSYFGSKLIKLPPELVLDEWDGTVTKVTTERSRYLLEFNLTRTIVNMFLTNSDFTDNWSALTDAGNVIDGYVKTTIIDYYNISRPKINVGMWTKPFDGQRIAYILNDTFTESNAKNIEGTLHYINSEYIYKIWVDVLPDLSYYFTFTLFEK